MFIFVFNSRRLFILPSSHHSFVFFVGSKHSTISKTNVLVSTILNHSSQSIPKNLSFPMEQKQEDGLHLAGKFLSHFCKVAIKALSNSGSSSSYRRGPNSRHRVPDITIWLASVISLRELIFTDKKISKQDSGSAFASIVNERIGCFISADETFRKEFLRNL